MVNKPVLWWDSLSHHCRNLLNRTCKLFNRGIQLWAVLLFFTLHPTLLFMEVAVLIVVTLHPTLLYFQIYLGCCATLCYYPSYSTRISDSWRWLCYSFLLSLLLYSTFIFMEVAVLLFVNLHPSLFYPHNNWGGCATLSYSPPYSTLLSALLVGLFYSLLLSTLLYSTLRFMEVAVVLFVTLHPTLLYSQIY